MFSHQPFSHLHRSFFLLLLIENYKKKKKTWTFSKKPNTENTATLVTEEHRDPLEHNPNIFAFTNTKNMLLLLLLSQLAYSRRLQALLRLIETLQAE